MTRRTIWTPPGLPRAAEQRAFHVMIGLAGAVSGRSLSREQLMPHEVIVAAWPIRAGQPPSAGGPLTVSAAGWTVADPLRLLQNARDDALCWGYLCLLARTATDLDLPRTASRWVAGELGTSWREAAHTQPDHLRALTRTASAAMTAVAEGEAHQRRLWTPDKDGAEEAWARMLRPDLGRPGWKAALDAVQSGHWSAGEIEPWGPMLDVSGAAPEAATETTMAAIGEALKRLARSVQGQAREPGAHTRPRRGVGGAPSPELDVDWCHDHPEVSAAWNAFEERGRAATTSRLAYQLGRRARDAAMARTLERVGPGESGQEGGHLSGLARAMGDLSVALTPVLAGVRGDKQNEANERRVDAVLLAWSGVGQDIPHLRPALSQLQLELDPLRCLRMRVSGVALSPETKTVYVNLGAGWADDELRYGFAELALHLLLGHPERSNTDSD